MTAATAIPHPAGFRRRRGVNWTFIGLLCTTFYMCRYNLSLSNQAISTEFGFSKARIGTIITTALLAYACALIVNGLLTDRLGGKRAMLVGAAVTIIVNVFFGVASSGACSVCLSHSRDGYMKAFGAPEMVKVNAAWFRKNERGRFGGIFGFMIKAPVAAGLYFLETAIVLLAAQFGSVSAAVVFLVLISFTANATHSILGTAGPMDRVGAKMAGFASRLIDSFQYFGGSLLGYLLDLLLDKSCGSFYFMAPFGIVGGLLIVSINGRVALAKPSR